MRYLIYHGILFITQSFSLEQITKNYAQLFLLQLSLGRITKCLKYYNTLLIADHFVAKYETGMILKIQRRKEHKDATCSMVIFEPNVYVGDSL